MEEKLKELNIENLIWYIYIFIAILALLSNYYEKNFYKYKVYQDKKLSHKINTIIYTIAIIIYIYFIYLNIKKAKRYFYSNLGLYAAIMFFVGGIIYLYIEVNNNTVEELAI